MSTFINSLGFSEVEPQYKAITGNVAIDLPLGNIMNLTNGDDHTKKFWYMVTPMYEKCIAGGAKIDLANARLFFDDEATAALFKLTHL